MSDLPDPIRDTVIIRDTVYYMYDYLNRISSHYDSSVDKIIAITAIFVAFALSISGLGLWYQNRGLPSALRKLRSRLKEAEVEQKKLNSLAATNIYHLLSTSAETYINIAVSAPGIPVQARNLTNAAEQLARLFLHTEKNKADIKVDDPYEKIEILVSMLEPSVAGFMSHYLHNADFSRVSGPHIGRALYLLIKVCNNHEMLNRLFSDKDHFDKTVLIHLPEDFWNEVIRLFTVTFRELPPGFKLPPPSRTSDPQSPSDQG